MKAQELWYLYKSSPRERVVGGGWDGVDHCWVSQGFRETCFTVHYTPQIRKKAEASVLCQQCL